MFLDLGTTSSNISVNYPDFAHNLCKKLQEITRIWVFWYAVQE